MNRREWIVLLVMLAVGAAAVALFNYAVPMAR
jgi:hypothetical protein